MILDGEEHMKPITEYRKPKPVTVNGKEHRKPSGRTDNLRSSLNCLVGSEHRKPITEYRKPKPVTLDEYNI